jgi:hypothetical protein
MAQTAAHLADHVIPPVPVRQWVISVPKRLRGMLADRPRAVAALTKIFLDEIERSLITASRVTAAGDTPRAACPRLGGISFLHRFGSALNHHVHLHACVTDGVFVPAADDAGCDAPPAFLPARPITAADLAALTVRVRRRVIRWFRMQQLLDAAAAADMLTWENSGFSIDASVRITLIDRDVPSFFQSLEHLLRYCARPPFALERLSVIRGPDGRIARIRYVLPRHKAANWVGPGRGRKSTRPGADGVVELTPYEFLDRLADLVPPPRKHRHRYHGVFAPNHRLRKGVTALAIGRGLARVPCSAGTRNRCLSPAAPGCRKRQGNRDRHRLLRSRSQSLARHLPNCLGETHGPGGGGVSARVPELWRRHPADCIHHGAGADPENPHASWRTTRATTGVARSRPANRLGRARANTR